MDNSNSLTGPIYIGGLSYSGKTQLRLMLDSHPDLSLTRRTYMWPKFYGRFGDLRNEENLARCLDAMLASPGIRQLEPGRERIEREFRAGPSPSPSQGDRDARLSPRPFQGEGDAGPSPSPSQGEGDEMAYGRLFALFHRHHAERRGKRRWGDQLGHVEQYADPIFAAQPDARMIHMVRDPRDRYAVVAGRGRARPGKLGWETMAWRRSAELGLRHSRRYAGRYLLVRYEDLLAETERVLGEVCAFLGERCYPEMVPGTAASPLDGTIWGSPTPVLSSRQTRDTIPRYVESQVGAEMEALGYEAAAGATIRPGRLRHWMDEPFNRAGALAWQLFAND